MNDWRGCGLETRREGIEGSTVKRLDAGLDSGVAECNLELNGHGSEK